jgi:hypothetical protein
MAKEHSMIVNAHICGVIAFSDKFLSNLINSESINRIHLVFASISNMWLFPAFHCDIL